MPDLASLVIKPDGARVVTPTIDSGSYSDYLVVLEGSFHFEHTGEVIDAVYRFRKDGTPLRKHSLLAWRPRTPPVVSEDSFGHRYVFRLPENWSMEGQSFTLGLDKNALMREFLLTNGDIQSQLSGEIRMTMRASAASGALPVWMGIPAIGMIAGAAWVIRRRRTFGGLDEDLARSVAILQEKTTAALKIASGQKRVSRQVKARLNTLQRGAVDLAQRLQEIRKSLLLSDSDRTEAEVAALEARLGSVTETTTRLDLEAALDHKRKALAAAQDLRAAEERCRLRLAKIEGVVDSTCLHLQRANVGDYAGPVEDTVLRELDSEVRAVGQVAREAEEQAYLRVR
jgi:hypothetical protein